MTNRPERIVGRQTKLTRKTRFHFLMEDANYDWLATVASARGISVAAALNQLLRELRGSVPRGMTAP